MAQLLGGWTSDIYGGDNVLFFTCTTWITVVFFTPFIIRNSNHFYLSSSTAYLLLRFLMGLCHGAFPGAMASLLGRKLETERKSSTNGIINSGAGIGCVEKSLFYHYGSFRILICLPIFGYELTVNGWKRRINE